MRQPLSRFFNDFNELTIFIPDPSRAAEHRERSSRCQSAGPGGAAAGGGLLLPRPEADAGRSLLLHGHCCRYQVADALRPPPRRRRFRAASDLNEPSSFLRFMVCSEHGEAQIFQLAECRGSKSGLYCGTDGVHLGPSPLIELREGAYVVRPEQEIAALLAAAYDPPPDAGSLRSRLQTIAEHLQRSDLGQAMISSVLLGFGEPSDPAVARLAEADRATRVVRQRRLHHVDRRTRGQSLPPPFQRFRLVYGHCASAARPRLSSALFAVRGPLRR
jgi:hypothetical protein